MEITCKRCQTEYDFDDALVSERGTTVRCTNCGEQFKVYRPTDAATQERWLVQRRDGRELLFTNVGDLQRAITNMQVGRHDVLIRGTNEPRPLGGIPELEPFFAGRLTQSLPAPPPQAVPTATQPYEPVLPRTSRSSTPGPVGGAGPRPGSALVEPRLTPEPRPLPASAFDAHAERLLESPSRQSTLTGIPAPAAAPAPAPPTTPRPGGADGAHGDGDGDARRRPAGPSMGAHTRLPNEVSYQRPQPTYDPSDAARISYGPEQDWFGESSVTNRGPRRSRALRGLVLLVVLGLLCVAGATVGRKYLAAIVRPPAQVAAPSGARVDALLEEGERALAEGDTDTAKESFDKASALAERDPRVLLALARIDAVRADRDWLKLKLLRPDQTDALATTRQQLDLAAKRAARSAAQVAAVAPDDPQTARAKIDAARLSGDQPGARALAPQVAAIAGQAETVYVLAALDLAEAAPNWPAVVDRLKLAAAGEQNLARARSALVYALVRSGDTRLAKSELDKIASAPRPSPVLPELKAFLAQPPSGDAEFTRRDGGSARLNDVNTGSAPTSLVASNAMNPSAGAIHPSGNPNANSPANANAPTQASSPARPQVNAGAANNRPPPRSEPAGSGDFRTLLQQAAKASASRQYDRAEQLYRLALAKNPGDNEALGGLGDVARARGNAGLARSYYEQVLARNAHYLPALSGLADIQWDAGERTSAAALYRQLVEASPDSSFARRARERIAAAEGSAAAKNAPSPQADQPPPTAPAAPPSTGTGSPPGGDTTDVPELPR